MESMMERIRTAIDIFAEKYRGESVVIYGCTIFAKGLYVLLREKGISVEAFVDNDKRKAGNRYLGVKIFLPELYLLPIDEKKLIIVCSVHEEEMLRSLYDMGYGHTNILHINAESEITLDTLECAEEQIERVRAGMEFYEALQREYGEGTVILVAPEASGDIFLACAYLQSWSKIFGINNYVLVGINTIISDIMDLYDFHGIVRVISKEEKNCLLEVYMFAGERLAIKPLSGWVLKRRNSYVANPQKPFLFKEAFKYETYCLEKDIVPEYPKKGDWITEVILKGIKRKKTIIISPYAYSSPTPMIPMEIWEEIANILDRKGYRIYTIGYGEKEPPIKGTLQIQFSYREACYVLEYAGGFLAARSGLCDIAHMANCKQLIIYGRNIRNPYISEFFSLKKNYEDFSGEEIIFDDYTVQDFVKFVTDYFTIF